MSDRKRGTSIRPLARVLDSSERPSWLIDAEGTLAYLSAACQPWLQVDIDQLLGRSTLMLSGAESELDHVARALAAPLTLAERGELHVNLRPWRASQEPAAHPLPVLFVALDPQATEVLALAGHPAPQPTTAEQAIALEIRSRLEAWQHQLPRLTRLPMAMGDSSAAERLRRQLMLAATCSEHLLLVGPAGSGRESAGQAIHRYRWEESHPRRAATSQPAPPIVVVDGSLMDAELLDATIAPVLHWLAETGESNATILLRDLEQMPQDAQIRLEQVCDQFAPRLCLIALSTMDIAGLQTAGRITAALAARLGVFAIVFAPLADRAVDIPVIATVLLERRRGQGEGRAERFNRQALDALVLYPWPQNLVELDAAVRHAIRTARTPAILREHLPLAVRSFAPPDPHAAQQRAINLDAALQKLERQLIVRALDQADGNRAEAARMLNISRSRLLRRLEEGDFAGEGS